MGTQNLPGPFLLDRTRFPDLLRTLTGHGFTVHGPIVREGAIVYGPIHSVDDLPIGWTDEQGPGSYRIMPRNDQALFGYVVGPHSWKRLFHPARVRLFQTQGTGGDVSLVPEPIQRPRLALLGARPCEVAAIRIQDRVLLGGEFQDPIYHGNREQAFLIAANCTEPGATCFCTSMGTGPRAHQDYDLALTEILEPDRHTFLVEVGSERGATLITELELPEASAEDRELASDKLANAAGRMGRSLDTTEIGKILHEAVEHPRWHAVAGRCLACANCTMVCPTCFCTSVEDVTDLTGDHAERWRFWDSCFTTDFSYIHGGSVRNSTHSKYRQWMTHKLASWQDQFDSLGCVGCGRCITWCPVGIDITEEAAAIRDTVTAGTPEHAGSKEP